MTAVRATLTTLVVTLAGVGLGVLASETGGELGVVLAVGGAAALMAISLRHAMRLRQSRAQAAPTPPPGNRGSPEDPAREDRSFAHICFYAGSVTITFATWRPALGLTVSEVFFMLAFAATAFDALRGRPVMPLPIALLLGTLAFVIGGAVSSLGAVDPQSSLVETIQGAYVMLLWVWCGAMVLQTPRQFRVAVSLWVVSAAVSGVAAVAQYAGVHLFVDPPAGDRTVGYTDHPNDLGGSSAVALVPALAIAAEAFTRGGRGRGTAWSAAALLIMAAIVLAGSVAGMLAGLLAMTAWLVSPAVRTPTRVAIAAVVVVGLAGAVVAGGRSSPLERVEEVTSSSIDTPEGGSGQTRLDVATAAWPRIVDDPVIGVGLDPGSAFVATIGGNGTRQANVIHNLPLAAWYEGGILALFGILLIGVGLARAMGSTWSGGDDEFAWALAAAMMASVVYLMTAPMYFQQYGWFPAVLLVAWWGRQRSSEALAVRIRAQPPGPGPALAEPG